MKELDFSGISTKALKVAVSNANVELGYNGFCMGIRCTKQCPFYCNGNKCKDNQNTIRMLFQEELNRREKDMNKMPELKAGMIVEYNKGVFRILLPLSYGLGACNSIGQDSSLCEESITNIFSNTKDNNYSHFFRNDTQTKSMELIWSRKSDKDIKIEELQKTIKTMEDNHTKSISEIKEQIKELKSE